jgi:hypothetical protein
MGGLYDGLQDGGREVVMDEMTMISSACSVEYSMST